MTAGRIARKNGGEVEPEAIHVHLFDPVTQAVDDHAPDDGMVGVQRVAGAGEVVVARAVCFQNVVRGVVEAAEAQSGPVMIAFGCVVEDHVENHLDTCAVERLDHIPEFVDRTKRILARAIRLMRRKEGNRLVAPVIRLPSGAS